MVKHASQIKIGIMINVNESVKSAGNAKYIYIYIVGILAHVFARMVSI